MLNQFRLHYPQGSFTSELLMIDHGLYVVRSLIQVGEIILATGLAASTTVEAAEDQARLRALALLNFDVNSSTAIASTSFESKPQNVSETLPAKEQAIKELNPTPLSKSVKAKKNAIASPAPTPSLLPEVETVTENLSQIEPLSSPPETIEPPDLILLDPVLANIEQDTKPLLSLSSEIPEQNGKLSLMNLAQTNGGSEATLALEASSLPLVNNSISTPSSEIETSQSVPSPTSDLSEPIDFSEVIARSNIELKRLNWTNDQGKNYLLQTYGKRSRQLLSDEELLEFLQHLESQPSPPSA